MNTLPDPVLLLIGTSLAIAVAALLWAEARHSQLGIWVAKPVASTLFVLAALWTGALASFFGQLILLGLVLSWLGDVFLIPDGRHFFVAGLGSFLLAHLAYSGAFLLQPLGVVSLGVAAVAMLICAIIILRWLWPHLQHRLRPAVVAYLLAISLMVVLAGGTIAAAGLYLFVGAVMFAVSDVFVAKDRFVASSVTNRFLGLPLYYGAQFIFALSV